MKYSVDHIPIGKLRPGIQMTPTTITIHSTGNPTSTARNERNWLTNPINNRIASWHICVDEKEALEAIPLNEVAYHTGNKTGNFSSIGVEICESGDRAKTLANASKLVAKLLKERSWGIDKLRRHYDWSGKVCPRILESNNWAGWERFKQDVQRELKGSSAAIQDNDQPSVWARDEWKWAEEKGYLDGTRPRDYLTREEFAVVLKRLVKAISD